VSHISSYETDIVLQTAISEGRSVEEDPGWEMLQEAIHACAEEMNLEVGRSIRDYYGRFVYCDWSLSGPTFERGVGVKVDRKTGKVMFLCDVYGGYELLARKVRDRIVQNFSALCVTKALAALNYEVELEELTDPVEGKKVLIRGVL